jgi:GNAT superfamily N-acetyltransferase
MSLCASPVRPRPRAPASPTSIAANTSPAEAIILAGDVRLTVRSVTAGDRDAQAALFGRMSQESRRMRFLTSKEAFSSRELTYFTNVDHLSHEALVAMDEHEGTMVAAARYVCFHDRPRTAEVAAEVADDLRGLGIGTALVQLTIQRARDNGIAVLIATTLVDNSRARGLLHRLGFHVHKRAGPELELVLNLDGPQGPTSPAYPERPATASLGLGPAGDGDRQG